MYERKLAGLRRLLAFVQLALALTVTHDYLLAKKSKIYSFAKCMVYIMLLDVKTSRAFSQNINRVVKEEF